MDLFKEPDTIPTNATLTRRLHELSELGTEMAALEPFLLAEPSPSLSLQPSLPGHFTLGTLRRVEGLGSRAILVNGYDRSQLVNVSLGGTLWRGVWMEPWDVQVLPVEAARPALKTDDGEPGPWEIFVVPAGYNSPTPAAVDNASVLSSLRQARDAIRNLPAERRARGVIVHVAAGDHFAEGGDGPVLDLSDADSGIAAGSPVVWRGHSEPGKPARLTSSVRIPANAWEADTSRPGRFRADLTALGVTDLSDAYDSGPRHTNQCASNGSRQELFFAGRPMTVGRYPNLASDGSWRFLSQGSTVNSTAFRAFGDGERPWLNASRLYVHGYFKFDWSDSYNAVHGMQRVANHSSGATDLVYNLGAPPNYGLREGSRYVVLNDLSLVDAPGEYFVDVETGWLYFIPPVTAQGGMAWAQEEIVVSTGSDLVTLSGTKHVSFEGLTLEYARRSALTAEGVTDLTVSNCTVANVGRHGLNISNSWDSSVRGSSVRDVGCGALMVSGGDAQTLKSSGLRVVGNDIHHYSRVTRTRQPGIGWGGVGIVVEGNAIHHAPHVGMIHQGAETPEGAEGAAANNLFFNNSLHDLVQSSADAGAFYVGRTWAHRGNVVRGNRFANIHPVEEIRQVGAPIPAIYLE